MINDNKDKLFDIIKLRLNDKQISNFENNNNNNILNSLDTHNNLNNELENNIDKLDNKINIIQEIEINDILLKRVKFLLENKQESLINVQNTYHSFEQNEKYKLEHINKMKIIQDELLNVIKEKKIN